MTLLTAGALTDPQLPTTQLQTCARLNDAWLGGVGRAPPQTKILTTPVFPSQYPRSLLSLVYIVLAVQHVLNDRMQADRHIKNETVPFHIML